MASKYDPLGSYLKELDSDCWDASFDRIEAVLGFLLPKSARDHVAWWANATEGSHSHARSWLNAGWRTEGTDLSAEFVRFRRVGDPVEKAKERGKLATVSAGDLHMQPEPPPTPARPPGLSAIDELLASLAKARPIFHSEADFQHALAWSMHEAGATKIRLERRFDSIAGYLDLLAELAGRVLGIELKYWTRLLEIEVLGETFSLKQQGAHPLSRYDFVKDIARLEALVKASDADVGYAIALTNDSFYWRPGRSGSMDDALRLHEDVALQGEVGWASSANPSTIRGREAAFDLRGCYPMVWRPFSRVAPNGGEFRYLAVEVRPNQKGGV